MPEILVSNTYFYCEEDGQNNMQQRRMLAQHYTTVTQDGSEDAWDEGVFGLTDVSPGIRGGAKHGAELLWGGGGSTGQGQRRMTECGLGSGGDYSVSPVGQLQDGTSVRIRDSSNNSPTFNSEGVVEGRAEVYHSEEWGTICDDSFDNNDALVFCRQMGNELGYSVVSGTMVSSGSTPDGSGTIWLDDLACSGSEATLDACSHNGWDSHNCGHSEDVGVRCKFLQADECESCPAGKFNGAVDSSPCSDCIAGKYR
jgi:hypothetical protein